MSSLEASTPSLTGDPGRWLASAVAAVPAPLSVALGFGDAVADIYTDMTVVEPVWRRFEADATLTLQQQFDYLEPWQIHLSGGATPFVIVLRDAAGPFALLPLCIEARRGLRVARFMGGTHINYGVPLLSARAPERLARQDLGAVLVAAAFAAGRIDAFDLQRMPARWDGVDNPFVTLPGQPNPNRGFSATLYPSFDALLKATRGGKRRQRMRTKEKRLGEAGAVVRSETETQDDALALLDVYLAQKACRLAAQGIENVFARPGTRAFMAELLRRSRLRAEPLYELNACESQADGVLATIGYGVFRRRVTLCTASLGDHPLAQHSPGELLIYKAIERACEAGRSAFDMGIGEERYKTAWADEIIELYDAFVPVTAAGRAIVAVERLKRMIKRQIRSNPTAWALVKRLRAWQARRRAPVASAPATSEADD